MFGHGCNFKGLDRQRNTCFKGLTGNNRFDYQCYDQHKCQRGNKIEYVFFIHGYQPV